MAKGRKQWDTFEDISSYSSKQAYRRNQKKKKRTGLKVFLSILFVLFIAVGGVMLYVSTILLGDLTTTVITEDREALGITEETKTEEGIVNIALFGVDARGDVETFTGRSDAIMVLSIDTIHNKIKLTSLLRDTRVYIGEECYYDSDCDKLNHAYAYGGPELAIRTINQNFGLDIKDYVTVNFAGMAQIVDAFGGVDIEVTDVEIEQINKNLKNLWNEDSASFSGDLIYLEASAGVVHLNGDQAVAYGRIRKIDSDNRRAERQQEVLSALLDKVHNISVTEYPSLLQQLAPLCETSLSISDAMELAPILLTDFTIERLSIPGDEENPSSGYYEGGAWMWDYDLGQAKEHITEFIYEGYEG